MQKYIITFIFQVIALNHQAALYDPAGLGGTEIMQKIIIGQSQLKTCARLSNMTIQANMATAQLDIDWRVKVSQGRVKLGKQPCVSAHTNSLSELDSDYLKSCDQSVQLHTITWKLSFIQPQIRICRFTFDSSRCYGNFGKRIDQEIANGKEVCNVAPDAASECLATKKNEAREIISKADRDFTNCRG